MKNLENISKEIRKLVLQMHSRANASHIGSSLSCVDILATLYFKILNIRNFEESDRDRFILSKGHAASALYATLAKKGLLPQKYLETYCLNGGKLCGHSDDYHLPGIEVASGSLGHGLPLANGLALAAKNDLKKYRIYVLMGDGECNEGSIWEAALFGANFKLDNLTVIVDRNHLQGLGRTEEVLKLGLLLKKWQAFGWQGCVINGHDYKQIEKACLQARKQKNAPFVIIAETIKGKGISFMENSLEWHYRAPDKDLLEKALKELE